MKKQTFSFCLLQYRHNPWLRESLNVGVLLFSPDVCEIRFKAKGWEGRLLKAYPSMQRANYTEDLKQVRRAVDQFRNISYRQQSLFKDPLESTYNRRDERAALALASHIYPSADSSYHWELGGAGLTSDIEGQIDSLFERFVDFDSTSTVPSRRPDSEVWSSVGQLIKERRLEKHLEYGKVFNTKLGRIRFQAGYQNGEYKVIQPLSFDLADEDYFVRKAAQWGGYAQALVQAKGASPSSSKFILGAPRNAALQTYFNNARDHLSWVVGEENVFDERQSNQLVDVISDDLRLH